MEKQDRKLTIVGHLEEFRKRIISSAIVLAIAFFIVCLFIEPVLTFLIQPVGKLTFISPAEAFVANITVAFFFAVFLSFPYITYQAWQFIVLALSEKERKYTLVFMILSVVLFCLGAAFAYFLILPIALKFLLSFSSIYIVPMITISRYISFAGVLVLSFGIVFEMPVIAVFLTALGVINPEIMSAKRKYAIVIIFIASAFLTPPDCITQILMAVPLLLLYEASVMFSRLVKISKERTN